MKISRIEVYNEDIDNSIRFEIQSENRKYETSVFSNNTILYKGSVSEREILSGNESEILSNNIVMWKNAVDSYIDNHNRSISSLSEDELSFKIMDSDSRFAYRYEEYYKGRKVSEGRGWYASFTTDEEKRAWTKAVREFKKSNGEKSITEKFKSKLDSISESLKEIDSNLPEISSIDPPLIELASAKMISGDICDVIDELSRAVNVCISRINGIPNPVEIAEYEMKVIKNNTNVSNLSESLGKGKTIYSAAEPVIKMMSDEDLLNRYEELDAVYEEYTKIYEEEIITIELCLTSDVWQPIQYEEIENIEMDTSELDVSDAPTPEEDEIYRIIAGTGKTAQRGGITYTNQMPDFKIKQNIYSMIRNLYIPLSKGWYAYCNAMGWLEKSNWGKFKFQISSGYRSKGSGDSNDRYNYNYAIKSTNSSAHTTGWAVDIYIAARAEKEWRDIDIMQIMCDFAFNYCVDNGIKFDQILHECKNDMKAETSGDWMHLGYMSSHGQRCEYYKKFNPNGASGKHNCYGSTCYPIQKGIINTSSKYASEDEYISKEFAKSKEFSTPWTQQDDESSKTNSIFETPWSKSSIT